TVGSLDGVRKASIEDLASVPTMTKRIAEQVRDYLREEKPGQSDNLPLWHDTALESCSIAEWIKASRCFSRIQAGRSGRRTTREPGPFRRDLSRKAKIVWLQLHESLKRNPGSSSTVPFKDSVKSPRRTAKSCTPGPAKAM